MAKSSVLHLNSTSTSSLAPLYHNIHPLHLAHSALHSTTIPPHQELRPSCLQCGIMFDSPTSRDVHKKYCNANGNSTQPHLNHPNSSPHHNNNVDRTTPNNQSSPPQTPQLSTSTSPPHHNNNNHPDYFRSDNANLEEALAHIGFSPNPTMPPNYQPHHLETLESLDHHYRMTGVPTTMASNGNGLSYPSPAHLQLYSPMTNANGGNAAPEKGGERGGDDKVILDMDSHKVHMDYQQSRQPPPPHHQQQQGMEGPPIAYHRPFLPPSNHHMPWLHPASQPPRPQDHFSPAQLFQQELSGLPIPPPHAQPFSMPLQNGGNSMFDGPRGAEGGAYGPPPTGLGYAPPTPSFQGSFPAPPPEDEEEVAGSSTGRKIAPPKKTSPKSPGGKKKNGGGGDESAPGFKTKGWKGGECKREKSHQCVTCDKWFTSGGHLKRHYGTTLHKNNERKSGSPPDMQRQTPSSSKKGGAKKSPKGKGGRPSSTQSLPSMGEGPSPSSSSQQLSPASGHSNNSSGPSTPTIFNGNHQPQAVPSSTNELGMNGGGNNGPLQNGVPSSTSSFAPQPPYLPQYNAPNLHPMQLQSFQPQHPYVLQTHFAPPGVGVPFSNGIPGGESLGGLYSTPMVPTSIYGAPNGGFMSTNGEARLPPFSHMALQRHYEQSSAYSQFNNTISPHSSLSSLSPASQQRLTPNGGGGGFAGGGGGGGGSPRGGDGMDGGFGGESRNSTNSLNEFSPEAVRGSSAVSGHLDECLELSELKAEVGDVSPVPSWSPDLSAASASSHSGRSSEGDWNSGEGGVGGESDENENVGGPPSGGGRGRPVDQKLKCTECGESTKTYRSSCYLTQHKKSQHSGGKPFKCSTCGKRFPLESTLRDHFARHVAEKPHKCTFPKCSKEFAYKTDLTRHIFFHTGEKPFRCPNCGKGFTRKDHMQKHVETHNRRSSPGQPKPRNRRANPDAELDNEANDIENQEN